MAVLPPPIASGAFLAALNSESDCQATLSARPFYPECNSSRKIKWPFSSTALDFVVSASRTFGQFVVTICNRVLMKCRHTVT